MLHIRKACARSVKDWKSDKAMIKSFFRDIFNNTPMVRLAVVGATGSGKTYLLTDMVGSIEKLGYQRDDSFEDVVLHRDVYHLTENHGDDGSVDKTVVYACRPEMVYSSQFLDPHEHRVKVEFADIPGEAMTADSINMFRSIMRAMMACKSNIFITTFWKNPNTHKMMKLLEVRDDALANGSGRITGLSGGVRLSPIGKSEVSAMASSRTYQPTPRRKEYYKQQGFEAVKEQPTSGATVFKEFLSYDTDSVINAISKAWELLKVDSLLNDHLRGAGSGKAVFERVYKNHFFFHYYTFYATDVVVCDKCCVPNIGLDVPHYSHFSVMVQALHDLTSYKDAPRKNWYLAFKGIDAIMQETSFRELFSSSGGDVNLVYSHILTLLRQACTNNILDTSEDLGMSLQYRSPFSSPDRVMEWLTSDDHADLADVLASHYDNLAADWMSFFKPSSDYVMTSEQTLARHLQEHLKAFCSLDERMSAAMKTKSDEQTLLNMPQHVYMVATPIDEDGHICPHNAEVPTTFDGKARHYNQRMHFGTLQLATSILLEHKLEVADEYNNYGLVLNYVHGAEM